MKKHAFLGLLLLFITLSWALRLYDLEGKSIWSDESLSIYRARRGLVFNLTNQIVIQGVVTRDTQPPLYFVLLHGLRAVAGESEFALRFLSVLFATLAIPLFYVTGKRFASPRVGLFSAGLAAAAPTYLWYAQEIRMYTMLVFISLLSSYALLRLISEEVGWRRSKQLWLATYLLSTGAMIYTHYSGFFLLLFQGLVVAAFILHSRRWRMLGLAAVAALVALPVIPFILRRLLSGVERDFAFVPLPIILYDMLNGLGVGIAVKLADIVWLDAAVLLILLIGLLAPQENRAWKRGYQLLYLLGYLLLPVLALYAVSHVKPMYMGVRHLLIISPAFYLAVAKSLSFLARSRTWPLALVAGLVLLGGNAYTTSNHFTGEPYAKDDLRSLSRYVRDHYRPGDVVVLSDAVIGSAFEYYTPDMPWTAQPSYGHLADDATLEACRQLAARYERIWFVYGPPSTFYDPQGMVGDWLEANLWKLDFRQFAGFGNEVGVLCYATRVPILELAPLPGVIPTTTDPSTPLHLAKYELPSRATPSGDALGIGLYWWLDRPAAGDYKVSLRLLDAEGRTWGQQDNPPFFFFPTSQWPTQRVIRQVGELLLSPATPPGRYRVELRVYRAENGEVIKVVGPDGKLWEAPVPLGEVEIGPAARPVRLEQLPPHRQLAARFGDEIALLAHTRWDHRYRPGDVLHLDLYWRAEEAPSRNYGLLLRVMGPGGQLVQELRAPLSLPSDATTGWRVGDLRRGQCDLTLPATLEAGEYAMQLSVVDLATGQPVGVRQGLLPWSGDALALPALRVARP